jgi:hypothetical protein
LSALAQAWLDLSPVEQPLPFFRALVDIEGEALLAGRRNTYLLLQDRDPQWLSLKTASFEEAQLRRAPAEPATARMLYVFGRDGGVRVASVPPLDYQGFVLQGQDWRCTFRPLVKSQPGLDGAD